MNFSRYARAAARVTLPFAGPVLANHWDDLAILDSPLPSLDWPRENERVFVLAPHPDDESLGSAGLLARCAARNVPVKIVFLTGGDGTRTTQIALKLSPRFGGPYDLLSIARERQTEALNAARALGLGEENLEFLGYPDGGMRAIWREGFSPNTPYVSPFTAKMRVPYDNARSPRAPFCRASVLADLRASLEEFRPTLALTTPAFDTHPDHAASFHFLRETISRSEFSPALWTFLIHEGIWPVPNGLHPDLRLVPPARLLRKYPWHALEISPDETQTKRRAINSHASQMASVPRYLNAFARRNELFCPAPNTP